MRSLVNERSFGDISVQDVTTLATVNRATFYAHYPDKLALLLSVHQDDFRSFMGSRFSERPSFSRDNLRRLVTGIIEFVGEKCGGCVHHLRDSEHILGAALQEELQELFKAWIEGEKPAEFRGQSPEVVATVLSWSVYGVALRWSRSKRKRTAEEIAQSVVDLFIPGS